MLDNWLFAKYESPFCIFLIGGSGASISEAPTLLQTMGVSGPLFLVDFILKLPSQVLDQDILGF